LPAPPVNLNQKITASIQRWGKKAAVVDGGQSVTYHELGERIEAARKELQDVGVRAGQRVGLLAGDSADYIAASFAVMAAGAAVSPISTELSRDEQQAIIEKVNLNAILYEEGRFQGARPESSRALGSYAFRFQWLDRDAPGPGGFARTNAAFVRFTSGTTGDCKGIVLSHETIRERIAAANAVFNIGPADTILWVLPMAYHFAVTVVSYLVHGATMILCGGASPAAMIEAVQRHKATILYASPTQYRALCDAPPAAPPGELSSVRLAISTSASLPPAVAKAFLARFGVALSNCYGLIEAGLPFINAEKPRDKRHSVGRATPGYEARLAGAGGKDCATGETGEIWLRGPGFLDAYYAPWRTRAEIMRDGWFHTGDMGRFDDEGFLRIVGRRKEIINCGGMKVFPAEIEQTLDAHPAVAESHVYGVPDPELGAVPVARVVLAPGCSAVPTAEQLIRHCRARLSAAETPRRIEFVAAIPRTASGKIRRR